MTDQQPELCDPETRVPSSHSCDLPDGHMGTHHCPACGAGWVFGSDCEGPETDAERSRAESPASDVPEPVAAATVPPGAITEAGAFASFGTETSGTPVRWDDGTYRHTACDTAIAGVRARAEAAEAKLAETERQLEHAREAAAGSHEGVRLWMLDCGEMVAKHRARAEAAEGKLAAIGALCRHQRASAPESVRTPTVAAVRILAIIGETQERSEEKGPDHG